MWYVCLHDNEYTCILARNRDDEVRKTCGNVHLIEYWIILFQYFFVQIIAGKREKLQSVLEYENGPQRYSILIHHPYTRYNIVCCLKIATSEPKVTEEALETALLSTLGALAATCHACSTIIVWHYYCVSFCCVFVFTPDESKNSWIREAQPLLRTAQQHVYIVSTFF